MPAKKPSAPTARLNRPDPAEDAFRQEYALAEAHNRKALDDWRLQHGPAVLAARRSGRPARVPAPKLVQAPPLPDFAALRSEAVTREVLGRYVYDADSGRVHDVSRATADCSVDAIRNATFVHFGGELDSLPDDRKACDCMAEEDSK